MYANETTLTTREDHNELSRVGSSGGKPSTVTKFKTQEVSSSSQERLSVDIFRNHDLPVLVGTEKTAANVTEMSLCRYTPKDSSQRSFLYYNTA